MPEFQIDLGDKVGAFHALPEFTQAYITAAFFTEEGPDNLKDATFADLAPETLAQICADCDAFHKATELWIQAAQESDQNKTGVDVAYAGRDFWYTRNGHGCGFRDGDWPEPYAAALERAAKTFGEFSLYLGDDGKIYA